MTSSAFSSGSGLIPPIKIQALSDGRRLDENPLRNPGLQLIIAPIGSGKTTLLLNLMGQMGDLYHQAIWVSPNGSLDPLVDRWLKEDDFKMISTAHELHSTLDEIEAHNRRLRGAGKDVERTLLVLDDCSADKSFFPHSQKNSLNHRLLSLRHLGITALIVMHGYRLCPKVLRLNASILYVFRVNELERKAICEEVRFPSQVVEDCYLEATEASPHNFLTIDLKHGRLYSCLERLLWEVPTKGKQQKSTAIDVQTHSSNTRSK